jgi:hypothetical protein
MNQEEITQYLKGTSWRGHFTALPQTGLKITSSIRIEFLSHLSANGALLYFHELTGNAPAALKYDDKAYEFTPRALKLMTSPKPNTAVGTISIFEPASSPTEESELEKLPNRPARKTLENVEVSVNKALKIIASIPGVVELVYEL